MTRHPVVVLDVNETLSDLAPLREVFVGLGADGSLVQAWFAGVLRDGFALTVAGTAAPFREIAEASARTVLGGVDVRVPVDDAVEQVMSALQSLPVHHDVPGGLRALDAAGLRVVTLTNGSASTSRQLLERSGLADLVSLHLSVEDVGVWKPAPAAYRWAATRCEVEVHELLLVAVHPWDIDGASRAGLRTAWLDRTGSPYPSHFRQPDLELPTLGSLAALLAEREKDG